jgi:hypothetical protein
MQFNTDILRRWLNRMNNKRFTDQDGALDKSVLDIPTTELYSRIPFDTESCVKITIRFLDEYKENVQIVV